MSPRSARAMPPLVRTLRPVDAIIILFTAFISILLLAFGGTNSEALTLVAVNIAGIFFLVWLASARARRPHVLLQAVHDWYPVPVIFFMFKEVYLVIQAMGRHDWDDVLIAVDHAVFGVHPTQWLAHYSFPLLTEILQVAYASYYFIMLAVGIEVFFREGREPFSYVLFVIVYGFFLSYIGYLLFPAVGPRFTLHDFRSLDTDLPGILLTTPIRDILNAGESIPKGAADALALAQRDAFPSGHTQMTLISLFLAHRYRLRSRFVLYVFGTLLIISTVYMRYHYVVDVVAGILFMAFTMWTAPKLVSWWERRRVRERTEGSLVS